LVRRPTLQNASQTQSERLVENGALKRKCNPSHQEANKQNVYGTIGPRGMEGDGKRYECAWPSHPQTGASSKQG
jgi:hypothetical protein